MKIHPIIFALLLIFSLAFLVTVVAFKQKCAVYVHTETVQGVDQDFKWVQCNLQP